MWCATPQASLLVVDEALLAEVSVDALGESVDSPDEAGLSIWAYLLSFWLSGAPLTLKLQSSTEERKQVLSQQVALLHSQVGRWHSCGMSCTASAPASTSLWWS